MITTIPWMQYGYNNTMYRIWLQQYHGHNMVTTIPYTQYGYNNTMDVISISTQYCHCTVIENLPNGSSHSTPKFTMNSIWEMILEDTVRDR